MYQLQINTLFVRGFNWFLPRTDLLSDFDFSKVRIINAIHLLFLLFSIVFIILDQYLIPENEVPLLLPTVGVLILQIIFKKLGNLPLSGNLTCLFLVLVLYPSIGASGGIFSDNLVWLIITPVLAFLLVGKRSGLFWLGALLAILVYFYVLEIQSIESYRAQTFKYDASYYFVSWGFLFLMVSLIIYAFSSGKNKLIQFLMESQKILLAQKEEIIQQSDLVKKNELKLTQLNEKLEHFAYAISHDLKEPLRSVKIYTQILEKNLDHVLSDTNREYMAFVQNGTDRMHALLVDLLEYSKIDDPTVGRKIIRLDDIILLVKNQLNAIIKETNTRIEIGENLPVLHANPSLLCLLFQNLINNAIKFRKDNQSSFIKISAEGDDQDNILIHLTDNGIGIEPKFQKEIFDVFTKIHSKDKYEGSGIGLSTCLKIMTGMNGNITLDSELNVGTTFHLFFPKEYVSSSSIIKELSLSNC